jgi:hypothetical protein
MFHIITIYYPYTVHVFYPQIVLYVAMYTNLYIAHKLSTFCYENHQYITLALPVFHLHIFSIYHLIYKLYSTIYTMCYHEYCVYVLLCSICSTSMKNRIQNVYNNLLSSEEWKRLYYFMVYKFLWFVNHNKINALF